MFIRSRRMSQPFQTRILRDSDATFCSWCHMTIDEFIDRLESLKRVDGVTGETPVVVAAASSPSNEDFPFPQHWETAIAEATNVNEKRRVDGANVWITEHETNGLGVVIAVV
jgi:hypothetical protein